MSQTCIRCKRDLRNPHAQPAHGVRTEAIRNGGNLTVRWGEICADCYRLQRLRELGEEAIR
jgi:hypothetical protein